VLKLPKSGGVVTVDPGHRKATAKRLVHEYLYGPRGLFCPRPIVLPFAQLRLFQVSAAQIAPQDALPIGFQAAEAHTQVGSACAPRRRSAARGGLRRGTAPQVKQVEPDASMVRRILAVAGQEPQDVQELASANSAGFVVLQDVDVEGKRVTVLAPNGLPMPSNVFLLGDLDFIE
jgi:polyribonucleotide 5'-hydroxyl-kinase